jgi:hypothetical protein
MVPMLEKRQNPYKKYVCALEKLRGHDPHEMAVNHVKSIGLTHSKIHEVNFVEEIFKGVLFFEEVLQILPDDVARGKLQMEQEEKKKILQEQFQLLLEEDQKKLQAMEQEKIKKEENWNKRE